MKECRQFYIDGKWVAPTRIHDFPVVNPATASTWSMMLCWLWSCTATRATALRVLDTFHANPR